MKWIKSTSRKPDSSKKLILAVRSLGSEFTRVGRCFKDGWAIEDKMGLASDSVVTHWMEFPEYPKTQKRKRTNAKRRK